MSPTSTEEQAETINLSPTSSRPTSRTTNMQAAELPALIRSVHDALVSLGSAPEPEPERQTPAVSIRQCVTRTRSSAWRTVKRSGR